MRVINWSTGCGQWRVSLRHSDVRVLAHVRVRGAYAARSGLLLVLALAIQWLTAPAGAAPGGVAPAGVDELSQRMAAAASGGTPFPDVADALPTAEAYALQRRVVALQRADGASVAGFKAGLTDESTWPRFGATAPVVGVLFEAGKLRGGAAIERDADDAPMIEMEIGYLVHETIDTVPSEEELTSKLIGEVAVVELPNLAYAAGPPRTPDIVGSNVASSRFIVGRVRPMDRIGRLDSVAVRLERDDVVVAEGSGTAALGGQAKALRWMIGELLKQGYTIEAGNLLITGALAGMQPAEPGRYRARFGMLGNIDFTVKSPAPAP